MESDARLAFLRQVPLFSQARLGDADLAQLLAGLEVRRAAAGSRLFAEGDRPDGMYLLVGGRVRIAKVVGATRVPLAELGPGDHFGELALLDDGPRSAGAEAGEDCELLFLPRQGFDDLLSRAPGLALAFFRLVSARLRLREGRLGATAAAAGDPVEDAYPFPIASIYRSYRVQTDARARLDRLLDLLEATVRYLSSVALANYLSSGPQSGRRSDHVDETLARGLDRASLGTHWLLVERSVEPFDDAPGAMFVPELYAFLCARHGRASAESRALMAMVTFRNQYRHGGGGLAQRELEAALQQQEETLAKVLPALAFLAAYPPVWLAGMEWKGGKFLYQVDRCTGSHAELKRETIALSEPREQGQLLLWSPAAGKAIPLHPWALLDTCEACGNRELFFFNQVDKGAAVYLEVRRGHRHVAATAEEIERVGREARARLRASEGTEAPG